MLRASAAAEAAGVRTVSIICSGFLAQAQAMAKLFGFPDATLAEYPGHVSMDLDAEFFEKVVSSVAPRVADALFREGADRP